MELGKDAGFVHRISDAPEARRPEMWRAKLEMDAGQLEADTGTAQLLIMAGDDLGLAAHLGRHARSIAAARVARATNDPS